MTVSQLLIPLSHAPSASSDVWNSWKIAGKQTFRYVTQSKNLLCLSSVVFVALSMPNSDRQSPGIFFTICGLTAVITTQVPFTIIPITGLYTLLHWMKE